MGQWRDFPLPDGSYSDATRPWTQQDVCNYLPTMAEAAGTASRVKYACVPGLASFATVGNGPHRGAHDVEGTLFVVSGETLYQVEPDGTATSKGDLPGTGLVSMTHNQIDGGSELLIGTRDNSYIYNTQTATLAATGVGLFSVDFLNQRFLGVDTSRRFWRYSGLADGTSWNMLDNESAESSPDRIVGLIVSQGEVLVFGERTIEVWSNSPTETTAFQRAEVIEKGCRNANTIRRLDNTVFFQGDDGIVYRLNGYQPVPVSPKALTTTLLAGDADKALAYTYEDNGYCIYYLTLQDGGTWGYDVTNQKWHRRESFGLSRWRVNTLVKWHGDWYAGDYSNGRLYKVQWRYVYEGCEVMPRTIRSGVLHNNGNRVFIHGFRVQMQSGGVESAGPTLPVFSGDVGDGNSGATVDYQYPYTADANTTIRIASGALPDGLSMDATGHVTGTRTTVGGYAWTVQLTDSCGNMVQIEDFSNTWGVSSLDPETGAVKYLVVEPSDGTDYSSPSLDDSGWSSGLAPFGNIDNASAAGVGFALTPVTPYPLGKTLWYRTQVYLASTAGLTMDIFGDDAATAWVNGQQFYTHASAGSSGIGEWYAAGVIVPEEHLVVGWNDLCFRSREIWGGQSYFDYRLMQPGYEPPETPASAPSVITSIPAHDEQTGHFISLRYSNDGANNFGMWQSRDSGETGAFTTELVWRRLGLAKHRVWELRDTSNVAADILGAQIFADTE